MYVCIILQAVKYFTVALGGVVDGVKHLQVDELAMARTPLPAVSHAGLGVVQAGGTARGCTPNTPPVQA